MLNYAWKNCHSGKKTNHSWDLKEDICFEWVAICEIFIFDNQINGMNEDYSSEETENSVAIKSQNIEATEVIYQNEDGKSLQKITYKYSY